MQIFGMVALVRGTPWWAVENPAAEVRPWAGSAADLLEKIPSKYVDHAMNANAAVSVVFGVGMMLFNRMEADRVVAMQIAQQRRQQMMDQEGVPPEAQPSSPNGRARSREGTGASSVHPGQVAGLGSMPQGL